ncbi:MAG TPA: glucose 1-dehydrogenase [Steroidobacteraceae bacterium]|jgi:NAD(P)-dependent dehydrogenase (short-subunit alcohol dehydrogenase family)
MRLRNKTALITGGNSGIGLATARVFVQEGARVVITGRNRKTLDAAVAELGPNAYGIEADVSDHQAIERAVGAAVERFGKLDVVFANAGIGGFTALGKTTVEDFERIIRTNLTGVFFTVQATEPHLNKGGSVILNGSVLASAGAPGYAAYAAAKGGVRSMARVFATELAPRGIRVNVVVPGATRTPIWSAAAPTEDAYAALEARLSKAVPLGRFSEAEEIAKAVLYFASDDAANTTGTELVVDGGMTGAPSGAPIYRA